jgi:uncharacterized protein YbbC (DUF1343 family)
MKNIALTILTMVVLVVFIACNPITSKVAGVVQYKADAVQNSKTALPEIICGADRTDLYVEALKGKNIGLVVNQTAIIGPNKVLLVDTLLARGLVIKKIFGPEHGFRGNASAGAKVDNFIDEKTKLPIISLYGKHLKPTADDLKGIDVMIFDIQDVGVRFYTYISTLHYVMEACAENNIELLILDRPNPNGFYIDGPMREGKYKSFVGMHPIPVVHGMTIGEYAQMINGEKWLDKGIQCKIKVIPMANYTHNTRYQLPVHPSPNLNTPESILHYPSICFFEGTTLSLGRGTQFPFLLLGHPDLKGKYEFSFKPVGIPGMSENPPQKDQLCFGIDLRSYDTDKIYDKGGLNLTWLIKLYRDFPDKNKFFTSFFSQLAGTANLQKQIEDGLDETQIRKSWEEGLNQFKSIRQKYLLYQ